MNEQKHWNVLAPTYNEEIFDVFESDKNKVLSRYFNKYANHQHTAIDFGCGNGKAFPYLSPRFKEVLGIDISKGLLSQAKKLPFSNVRLLQADLTKSSLRIPKANFIFCCNVAILTDVDANTRMIQNMKRLLREEGHAVIVVPAMESALFSSWRLIDWYKKEGVKPHDIDDSELNLFSAARVDVLQGLINIDGKLTKHYSELEISVLFERSGLQVLALEKVEYNWTSEFSDPPAWLKAPYPWDWLVECKLR